MSRHLAIAALAALIAAATPATARDYDPDSGDWNGTSYLFETASEAKVTLERLDVLDWATIGPRDVLLVVFPSASIGPDNAAAFLEDGGHIVVADDFGASGELLSRVGIHRLEARPRHDRFFKDNPHFPLFEPEGEHFLFFNIGSAGSQVIANHPAAFATDPGVSVVLPYADGDAFIAEARVGRGALLAVADGSILINEMMRKHGDKQLAANLLRYYCLGDACTVKLVLPGTPVMGAFTPRGDRDRAGLDALFRDSVRVIDSSIAKAADFLGRREVVRPLALLAITALVLLALAALPTGTERKHFAWQSTPSPTAGEPATLASGLSQAHATADFTRPALVLERVVERALAPLGLGDAASAESLARRFAERVHPRDPREREVTRRKLLNLLTFFASVRAPGHPEGARTPTKQPQFEAIYSDARHVLTLAGEPEPGDWALRLERPARPGRRQAPRHGARDPEGLHR